MWKSLAIICNLFLFFKWNDVQQIKKVPTNLTFYIAICNVFHFLSFFFGGDRFQNWTQIAFFNVHILNNYTGVLNNVYQTNKQASIPELYNSQTDSFKET